ncbi:MAG: SurA N-terminal domain-containing protein [Desulfovermiculus sp.]|nr:SurA N-terminal domain-containing protein [Desulfovermiculus sp.]
MLEVIRNNAQSWGVKLLFAIIVLVFVFWGVGSFRNPERQVVASVGDQDIGLKEFVQNYQRQVEAMRQQQGDISSQDLKNMDLKRQVLEQMINERLIQAKAEELGLFVGSGEVRTRIRGMSVFQGDNAQFDPNRYQGLLRMNNLSPAQFETDIRMDLVGETLRRVVTSPVRVPESEARELFDYMQAQATIDYVRFPAQDYMQQVEVSDEDIESYYQEHKQEYERPASMSMQAVVLTPKTLAQGQEVGLEEIEAYYQDHQEEFTRPEQVKAGHILIRVADNASQEEEEEAKQEIEEAAKRLDEGADFDQLAQEVSEGPSAERGGDLGWFGRNSMVQEFEEVAFDLQPGEISQPVRTQFGYHLIQVTDKRDSGVQPLEQVQEEIKKRLARNKAMQVLEDRLDEVLQIVLTSGDMQQAADAVGLSVQEIGPISKENPPEQFGLDQKQMEKLLNMEEGEIADTPIMLDDGYVMVKKTGHESAHIPALNQIEDKVRAEVEEQRARELAKAAAQDALDQLTTEKTIQDLGFEVQTSQPFTRRQGSIPGLGQNQELVQAVFAAPKGQWLDTPYVVQDVTILGRLKEASPPEDTLWEEQKSFWIENVRRLREQTLFQAYLQGLRDSAEVSILIPEALTYQG